jgi:hypothetical protein
MKNKLSNKIYFFYIIFLGLIFFLFLFFITKKYKNSKEKEFLLHFKDPRKESFTIIEKDLKEQNLENIKKKNEEINKFYLETKEKWDYLKKIREKISDIRNGIKQKEISIRELKDSFLFRGLGLAKNFFQDERFLKLKNELSELKKEFSLKKEEEKIKKDEILELENKIKNIKEEIKEIKK